MAGFMDVDRPNVVVDWVKKAEDSEALVVRLYESHGARGLVEMSFANTLISAAECDLLEHDDREVSTDGSVVKFQIKPWEIRTFKVRLVGSRGGEVSIPSPPKTAKGSQKKRYGAQLQR